jgi:hypothetical protein
VLARADAAQAVDKGWGELHPLAGRTAGLPATYVLLYSPRNPNEVAVVERLLDAAAAHMTADAQRGCGGFSQAMPLVRRTP